MNSLTNDMNLKKKIERDKNNVKRCEFCSLYEHSWSSSLSSSMLRRYQARVGHTINTYSQLNRYEFGYRLNCCNSKTGVKSSVRRAYTISKAVRVARAGDYGTSMVKPKQTKRSMYTKYDLRCVFLLLLFFFLCVVFYTLCVGR